MEVFKALVPTKWRKLDDLAQHFNVPLLKHRNIHTALIDTEILVECVQAMKHMESEKKCDNAALNRGNSTEL